MKDVLISTQPKWVAKICNEIYKRADGTPVYEKEIEVRKTRPKQEVPFRCLIYACKPKKYYKVSSCLATSDELLWLSNGKVKMSDGFEYWADDRPCELLSGKVIGEFVCDRIDEYECEFVHNYCLETVHLINRANCEDEDYPQRTLIWSNEDEDYNFSSDDEIIKGSCVSYKELKQYMGYGFNTFYGWHISNLVIYDKPKELSEFRNTKGEPITRAFQSWGYVNAEID